MEKTESKSVFPVSAGKPSAGIFGCWAGIIPPEGVRGLSVVYITLHRLSDKRLTKGFAKP
jgi:hypothetical protein